jgi:hypothetical protein
MKDGDDAHGPLTFSNLVDDPVTSDPQRPQAGEATAKAFPRLGIALERRDCVQDRCNDPWVEGGELLAR